MNCIHGIKTCNDCLDKIAREQDALFKLLKREEEHTTAWRNVVAESYEDSAYYRGLLLEIGQMFGDEAHFSDDGTYQEGILVAKLPDLVRKLIDERNQK
jgi:hypothetical protein